MENNLYTVVVAPSPVDKIVNAAEIFYAARFELDKDALAIGAQLAMFAYANGWGTMRDRGASIALSMQREAGFESASGDPWPKSDNDLAPLPQFEASEE